MFQNQNGQIYFFFFVLRGTNIVDDLFWGRVGKRVPKWIGLPANTVPSNAN